MTWRRVLVVAVPLAAAVAGAAILLPGGSRTATRGPAGRPAATRLARSGLGSRAGTEGEPRRPWRPPAPPRATRGASVPGPSPNRIQRITTALELARPEHAGRLRRHEEAVAIAHALGGYPSSLNIQAAERTGYAEITLRVPKQNVQRAVSAALGPRHDRRRERRDQGHHQARSTRPPARSRGSRPGSPTGRPSPQATRPPGMSRRSRRRSRS